MKKKLKKSLACLLAALLIFSIVPMSALADETDTPVSVTVETNAEKAAQDTEPDAEPKPETTAEPTATPEASAKPSAEPTAEPSPEVTEEPAEPETSAEPEATAEPTASPTPNPEDGISLLALGDEAVTRYRTVGINGNFSSNYLYDLGQYPLYDILLNGTSYPAYCLQHGKGRVNNGAYVQRDNYGMTEAMRRIVAYGFNNTNSLQDGNAGWYSAETAKMMVTQHLVWLASEGYITVNGTNWSWGPGIDTDVERMANLAYNGSVVRSYYAELKDRLLRSEIVPSFAGKSSDGSDAQEIDLQLVNGKYTATVTDTNGVLDLFDFQKAGFDISRNGNTLTISASTLPEQETTIIGAGYTVGDKNNIAVWEDKDQQANIQHQATCPGTTKTMAYIKIKGEKPSYTITLNKTSADLTVTNGNPNYSLEGAVYYVYEYVNTPDYPYWDYEPYATFTTDANGHAELSRKLSPNEYVTFEAVAPKGYCADSKIHKFTVTGETTLNVVDDPGVIRLVVRKKDSDTNTGTPTGNASLEGAVYRVSYMQDGQEVYKDITTNNSGVATLRDIPLGLVKVQEIKSPVGYKLDERVRTYNITTVGSEDVFELEPADFTEEVMKGQIALHKQYETLDDLAEEQGAEFDIYLKSAGGYADAKETERDHITTGADGMATTKDLPYGTYVVHQTKGGNGRQLVSDFDVSISEDGKVYSYDLVNIQKNAQLKIVKTSEDGVIEGIKFRVTRLEDNYSAEYVTNAAGEILTETLPIYADKDGATKYQYKVEELDTEKTYGYQLPDPQIVELSEGEIASVSFHNVPIEIGTKATVEGEKEVDPLDKVTLTDTVSYTGLIPGKEYKVTGVLMDKETGEKLLVDGKEITAETVFVPETKNGSVDVTFIFDATGLHGKEIVVFEDLYRENMLLATHADINDKDQTVRILPLHGSIMTTKVNADDLTDKISGATFGVYSDADGDCIFNAKTDKLVGTLQEGDTGVYTLDSLPYGKFFLHEDKAPEGFVQDNIYYPFEIKEDGQIVNFETVPGKDFPNKPIKGTVTTTKVDATNPQHKLSGAVFEIYRDADGDGRYTEGVDTLIGRMDEIETGFYSLSDLVYGKYLIYEAQAPANFVRDTIYYPFEITEDGQTVTFETIPGKDFPNSPVPNRPKTGSSRSVLPYIAFAGSALGLTTVLLVRRKKSK